MITVLTADNNFIDMPLIALTNTTFDVAATNPATGQAINIATGPDRIVAGPAGPAREGRDDHDRGGHRLSTRRQPARYVRQRRLAEAESDRRGGWQRRGAERDCSTRRAAGGASHAGYSDQRDARQDDHATTWTTSIRRGRGWSAASTTAARRRSTTRRHRGRAGHRKPAIQLRHRRRSDQSVQRPLHRGRPGRDRRVRAQPVQS